MEKSREICYLEFINRATTGYLMKIRKRLCKVNNWYECENEFDSPTSIRILDPVWTRESGELKYHEFTLNNMKSALKNRPYYPTKKQRKERRKELAK